MALPDHLNPFVLPIDPRAAERHGSVDLYPPQTAQARPAVVFVHGGPIPAELRPTPRDWPVYRAYGSIAAARGIVGVTVDHRLHAPADYPLAADDVAATVALARADPRVDADRVAIWFFSGGGLLLADWLRRPPIWLRCVAATYPVLAPLPGRSVGFLPRARRVLRRRWRVQAPRTAGPSHHRPPRAGRTPAPPGCPLSYRGHCGGAPVCGSFDDVAKPRSAGSIRHNRLTSVR